MLAASVWFAMRRNCALKLPLSWLLIHNGLSNFAVLFTKMSCTIYTILIKCLHNKSQPIPKRFIRMTNNRWFTNRKRNTWMQSKCKQLCIDDSNCLENDFSGEIRRFLRCALYFLSLCLGVRNANTELHTSPEHAIVVFYTKYCPLLINYRFHWYSFNYMALRFVFYSITFLSLSVIYQLAAGFITVSFFFISLKFLFYVFIVMMEQLRFEIALVRLDKFHKMFVFAAVSAVSVVVFL